MRVPTLPHPVYLRAGTSDVLVFEQIVVRQEADIRLDHEPTFIIDAGANIGLTTVTFACRYPSCRIVALEVEAENCALLRRNAAKYPNVIARRVALWSHAGFVRITNPTADAWAFQVESASGDDPAAIPTTTVSRLMEEFDAPEVSLLKMDIEGSEQHVLSDGDLDWVHRTSTLAVELHDRFKPGCTDALNSLMSRRESRCHQQGEYVVVRFS